MKDWLYVIPNIPKFSTMTAGKEFRNARWNDESKSWNIFVGKRGGNLRSYKTLTPMDKAMKKLGYVRKEILEESKCM